MLGLGRAAERLGLRHLAGRGLLATGRCDLRAVGEDETGSEARSRRDSSSPRGRCRPVPRSPCGQTPSTRCHQAPGSRLLGSSSLAATAAGSRPARPVRASATRATGCPRPLRPARQEAELLGAEHRPARALCLRSSAGRQRGRAAGDALGAAPRKPRTRQQTVAPRVMFASVSRLWGRMALDSR